MNDTLPADQPSPGDVDPVPCPNELPHDMHPWHSDGDAGGRPELCPGVPTDELLAEVIEAARILGDPEAGPILDAAVLGHSGRAEAQIVGCDACRVVGPLLTAPGTSGRTWRCECGAEWRQEIALMPAAWLDTDGDVRPLAHWCLANNCVCIEERVRQGWTLLYRVTS